MRLTAIAFAAVAVMSASVARADTPAAQFFGHLSTLCGKSFLGKVVSTDAVDDSFRTVPLVMTVASCTDTEIRIPFAVGEDRSRTWVITKLDNGHLRLKHDHRHTDGSEDELSQYGGDTVDAGTAEVQAFPVDAYSIGLFTRTNRTVSNTNVWTVEVREGEFVYQLSRENRLFRVSFDLNKPL